MTQFKAPQGKTVHVTKELVSASLLTRDQSHLQRRSLGCSQIQHQSTHAQRQKEPEFLKSSLNIMKFRGHHMQLSNSRRENADPHHGEADLEVPNFVQQETFQQHR
jgi:hypothetical protein